jgi:hypothetical protein
MKGRQLQQGAHKGPIRIDTPPPEDQSGVWQRQKSFNSRKAPISEGTSKMYHKSKIQYPKRRMMS